jgi:FKBP-type peptidyl-prolyl cis-trans isomerase
MSRKALFAYLTALLALISAPVTIAQDSDMDYALQDAREWASAMAFVESQGLDVSMGVESGTGVWILVMEEGEGPPARASNTVTAHATGWLADGTKFWSSHDGDDTPMVNKVTGFVKGFTQGLLKMQAGGTYMLVFPGGLGYGPGGNPGAGIPPNATLIFKVELISIE